MKPSMIVQICNLCEGPITIKTDIWSIVGVDTFMIPQIGLLRKALLTIATNILFIRWVVSNVIQERRLTVKDFLTQRTFSFVAKKNFSLKILNLQNYILKFNNLYTYIKIHQCLFKFKSWCECLQLKKIHKQFFSFQSRQKNQHNFFMLIFLMNEAQKHSFFSLSIFLPTRNHMFS